MEFRLLGPFEASVDGESIELTARRPRALLALLLLRAGEAVSLDSLADSLWDGRPPASAASVLRVYITQLRRALPADRLLRRSSGYALLAEPDEIDAHRFELLLADARQALAEGNARLASTLHTRALELWRGDALADLAGASFARDEAARLNELRLVCVEGRLEAELALGRHELVLPELEQLVATQPLRERPRAQLMLALYRAGRQADALACYRAGRTALVDELGLEPGLELRELERRILDHDPLLAAPAPDEEATSVVPAPQTATIGRGRELAAIREQLLDPETRLVTLVGPGGIGKTRLAVELAHALTPAQADGAAIVDLAPLTDSTQLVPAISTALALREQGTASLHDLLVEYLRGRELLLVLDNFEHLVDGAASVVTLLDAAPRLTILATSRRRLRLSAEHVVDVPPLAGPAASKLLAQRASAAGATFDPNDASLGKISDRLEGVPLAIELAAPWLRTLHPRELAERLDSRLDVLSEGPRDAPARQRTMRSVIDWSFDQLDPGAQHLLGRLSVFRDAFTTAAALDVGGPDADLEQLAELVDASIVQSQNGLHRLLDVVREYASELPSADEEGRSLHADHFVSLAEEAESELAGSEQTVWLERLEGQHDDLRAALDWLGQRGNSGLELRLAGALGRFWYIRGHLSEGLERLQRAAGRAQEDGPTLAKALRSGSALALLRGDYAVAQALVERALAIYRGESDETGVVRSLSNLGAILHARGELELAASTLDECIRGAEALGDARLTALARNNRGDVALSQGDFDLASEQFAQSLVLLRAADDVANVARALYNIGAVAIELGRDDEARASLVESLELSARVDDQEDVAWCLIGLAALAAENGAPHDAASMLGFTSRLLERIGATMKPNEQRLFERTRERLAAAFDEAALTDAFATGERLPWADAVDLGLGAPRQLPPP